MVYLCFCHKAILSQLSDPYPNQARARASMPGRMSASAMEEHPMSTTESG